MVLTFLPSDLFRWLLQFLSDQDQIQVLSCSSNYNRWRKIVRKVFVSTRKLSQDQESFPKLLTLIEDPEKQLLITIEDLIQYKQKIFPVNKFFGLRIESISTLSELSHQKNELKINTADLRIEYEELTEASLNDLAKICELGFIKNLRLGGILATGHFLPYFPKIESLFLQVLDIYDQALPSLYTPHLRKLELNRCSNIDVSCLSDIPDITISKCNRVLGASCLSNNRKIKIEFSKIFDSSLSFTNCEQIYLGWVEGPNLISLDLSKWQKVRTLTLKNETPKFHFINNTLPSTVRRCYLGGPFIESVSWKPFTNQLTELELSLSKAITSLKGLGLNHIPVLSLQWLTNLTSLEGLGKGNRKVSVLSCHNVTAFSALRSVDTVVIDNCNAFQDVAEVNQVRALTLHVGLKLENLDSLGKTTEMLSIIPVGIYGYDTFSRIPHVVLKQFDLAAIQSFLSNGGTFQNQTIQFYYYRSRHKTDVDTLYRKYFVSDYHRHDLCEGRAHSIKLIRKSK